MHRFVGGEMSVRTRVCLEYTGQGVEYAGAGRSSFLSISFLLCFVDGIPS